MDVKRLILISVLLFAQHGSGQAAEAGRPLRATPSVSSPSSVSPSDRVTVLLAGAVERPGAVGLAAAQASVANALAAAGGTSRQSYRLATLLLRRSRADTAQAECLPLDARHAALLIEDDPLLAVRKDLVSQLLSGQLIRLDARDDIVSEPGVPTFLLHDGDLLAVPARSSVVYVATTGGAIRRLRHEPSAPAESYLKQLSKADRQGADDFVLHYPNGRQLELAIEAWRYRPTMVPPGSLIAPDQVCLRRE